MIYDFVIVGHGLAGAILGYTLRRQGHQVLVIDELPEHSSSKVAAGLVNPVAGKRFAKAWLADSFIPAADAFYKELEEHFRQELYFHKPIYKIFSSIEEQNTWMAKSAESSWNEYIAETRITSAGEPGINDQFGGLLIKRGGQLLVREMLQLLEQELLDAGLLLPERFDFNSLQLTATGIRYKQVQARQLVFCEGYQVIHNPYFKWLPMQPTKGEVLEVKTEYKFISECIYNKGVYVLPNGEGTFRVGATYNWRQPDEEPTQEGQQELTERFRQITPHAFRVTDHWAGIRPAVRDRKPLVGRHPEHPQLLVFNGMGSKGVLMAPYLAARFAASLAAATDMLSEVNISRYFSLYYDYIKR
ncbi:FAD-dependent oxidoreductase [Pontibacter qinzhouensis]|uniref:FAD-dependent oxidoreductase n=1 Tax=Pontibacter qinzhouensis TaxID=2603253 RepID=A0A5C8KA17_9BACT|nr:FAD-dependent oxidoreductase [Pontibacter qinzhouensis]TXK46056.1 FAD-dependent oxidoreductase [Pontibacter qinzhouensis]